MNRGCYLRSPLAREWCLVQKFDQFFEKKLYLAASLFPYIFMNKTSTQYDKVINACRDIFIKKMKDYGTAWRILRTSSITDQLFIKAQRIRNIEDKGNQKIDDDIRSEYIGIINYSVIGLIQLTMKTDSRMELPVEEVSKLYDTHVAEAKKL